MQGNFLMAEREKCKQHGQLTHFKLSQTVVRNNTAFVIIIGMWTDHIISQ